MRKILAVSPFLLILLFILLFYLSGLYHYFNFQTIQQEHLKWKGFVEVHPGLSAFYFICIYIFSVLLVIPDSTVLTILGGFLFPLPLAVLYVVFSETLGATLFFLATRAAFAETLNNRAFFSRSRFREKLQKDQVYYLLFLRFSHLLPFWLINLTAGALNLRTWTFLWTTFIGILPLSYFLAEGGSSLSKYFETHDHFILRDIFTPELKITLIVLGCLALLPLIYKKFKNSSIS